MEQTADWAKELARQHLAASLPRRWAHTQGVAARARGLASILGDDADRLEAAAWLQDVGYAPDLVVTGFHPLDGARYLNHVGAEDLLCRLVAHHSGAMEEAEERGLWTQLNHDFQATPSDIADALTYCDLTTAPDGEETTVEDRIAEVLSRYGPDDVVSRSLSRSAPRLIDAVECTTKRLARLHSEGSAP